MKLKTLCMVISAAMLTVPLAGNAQNAPAAGIQNRPQEKKQSLDEMLAFIPEDVVSINGKVQVKRKELVDILKPQLQQAVQFGQNIPAAELKAFAVSMANNIAIQRVLVDHVLKQGIKMDRAATEKMLQEYKDKMGGEVFEKMLKQQNINYDTLVTRLTEMNAIKTWQDNVLGMVPPVAEKEMKEYYEKNKQQFKAEKTFSASHILVKFASEKPSENEKKNALEKIEKIRAKLLTGADFATLAKKESDCPSKDQGGSLGEFPEGRMVPEFENALKTMKENEISKPVLTQFGYHIIKAGPQKEARQKTFEEAAAGIKSVLTEQNNNKVMKEKIDAIVKANNIKVLIK